MARLTENGADHVRALALDAASYQRHSLHADERVWVEKNCYVDIWLEVIHALGCDPMAILPFVVGIDFEDDQWTFFKPPHDELWDLYGIDVQELNVWRPLVEHAQEHLGAGKLISTEADAWWLPDTSGTDYRTQHTKTTIVLNELDLANGRLGYFHNASYHALEGEDFQRTFRIGPGFEVRDPGFLPLFAELVRVDRVVRRAPDELRAIARARLQRHLAKRAPGNPVARFRARWDRDLAWLTEKGLATYHAWAFGTIRQLGAAAELAQLHAAWAFGDDGADAAFGEVSQGAKTFILKAARAVNGKRALDATAIFDALEGGWQRGLDALAARVA
jgi:hypothetical protein